MKEEIKAWLKQIGMNREWLADKVGVSKPTVDTWLSTDRGIPEKAQLLIRQMMEDSQKLAEGISTNIFSVECTLEQFRRFSRAALEDGVILEDWALRILDEEAKAHFARERYDDDAPATLTTFTDEPKYPARDLRTYSIPLFRAAAGAPILSDAEIVEVDQDPGMGRFLLELRGDSMEPQFRHRQRVILRHKSTLKRPLLKYGEFYAFIVDGLVTFKQWAKDKEGNKVMHSLNPEHTDIPADETTDWIGWFDAKDNA